MRKIIWMVVSLLMVLALVLASCGEAVTEEEEEVVTEEEEVVTEEEEEEVAEEEEEEVVTEGPQYGGTLVMPLDRVVTGFDDHVLGSHTTPVTAALTQESLITTDWAKANAGSSDINIALVNTPFAWGYQVGNLIDEWSFPDQDTIILKVRDGVHWGLNPDSEASLLVGGREITAEDIAFNVESFFTMPTAWGARVYSRWWKATDEQPWVGSATVIDEDTVELKGHNDPGATAGTWEAISDWNYTYAPEVYEKYGNANDWRNCVGTGPFMLTDYVSGSSATLIRNPNYWMTNPVGPGKGDQIPYVDEVKFIILEDLSTRLAAVRTQKIDIAGLRSLVEVEDFEPLIEANPELEYVPIVSKNPGQIFFRIDKAPYDDVNVRRAMHMAINFEEIRDVYYDGNAFYPTWPIPRVKGIEDAWVSVEELPEESAILYQYKPETAKQLLDDAGYPGPNRFETEVVCWNEEQVDLLSILASYWGDIGIKLNINVKEYGIYRSMSTGGTFEHGTVGTFAVIAAPFKLVEIKYPSTSNYARWYDDHFMEMHTSIWSVDMIGNLDAKIAVGREMNLYVIPKAVGIGLPFNDAYRVWWPWVKNYRGEYGIGYMDCYNFAKFVWIDQDLKAEMTGR